MKNSNTSSTAARKPISTAARKPISGVRVSEEGVEGFDFATEQETFRIEYGLTVSTTDGMIYRLDKPTNIAAEADALASVIRAKGSIDPTLWRRIDNPTVAPGYGRQRR